MYGFFRAGAAVPKLKVADCNYNKVQIMELINEAEKNKVKAIVFPELCLSAYTCADLFLQRTLINECEKVLSEIAEETKDKDIFIILGLPVEADSTTFNCAAVLHKGKILGAVPKTYIPNYGEFYEKRWFSSSNAVLSSEIMLCGQKVPFGANMLFRDFKRPEITFAIEICEDLWSPIPPSSYYAVKGATVIFNLSASNELAAKNEYRRSLVSGQSASAICGYVYSSSGVGESTQDLVFSGHSLICENGSLLKENKRFSMENQLIYADLDIERLYNDRKKNTSFGELMAKSENFVYIDIETGEWKEELCRFVNRMPFVPKNDGMLFERCDDIFNIQVAGLAKRIEHTNAKALVIGISGGLDSTLALLVAVKACDRLGLDRKTVLGITMPGFGTTDRTYNNALSLMEAL